MFRKIRFDGAKVRLEKLEKNTERKGQTKGGFIEASDLPLTDFSVALQAFAPLVVGLLDLPGHWSGELTVRSVSISQEDEDDRLGITVHLLKEVDGANSPWNIHTPHLRQPLTDAETGASGFYDDEWQQALDDLSVEAERYWAGERQQTNLFDGAESESEDEPAGVGA